MNFDAATKNVKPEDLAETVPAGPDVEKHLGGIASFHDVGINHLSVAYPGRDIEGFLRFWGEELRPKLQSAVVP